jgi:thiamine-monophosphate kinase
MKIDEDVFIADLLSRLNHGDDVIVPPGDDCAGIRIDSETLLLLAVDQVVGDVHYHGVDAESPTPPKLAGRKLMARNLSDIAAMGGVPTHALTAIAWRKDGGRERLNEFMDGVRECAEAFGVDLVGGDLCASSNEASSLTIVGRVEPGNVCLRRNAKVGDRILVTGYFGGSLRSGRHLTFEPRLQEGRWLATHGFTRCMIDVSDGLQKDLHRICSASSTAARIDGRVIPTHSECCASDALMDGEDYELLFTVPKAMMGDLSVAWPFDTALTEIGEIVEGSSGTVSIEPTGELGRGFDHFV